MKIPDHFQYMTSQPPAPQWDTVLGEEPYDADSDDPTKAGNGATMQPLLADHTVNIKGRTADGDETG
jgi:hypothetical protein